MDVEYEEEMKVQKEPAFRVDWGTNFVEVDMAASCIVDY